MGRSAIQRDWVGRVIDGQFTLVEWLGGSESEGVFLTELRGLPWQKAAIKLIPADAADAEAQMVAWEVTRKLSHPHLIRLIDTGRCRMDDVSLIYAVTEYTEEVLAQILPERPLTPTETGEMLGPVVDALTYLHCNGIAHGQLKPSNIMVVEDVLKISSDSLHIAGEGRKGAKALTIYDAPETAVEIISPAADVWSLGVTLVEALTQKLPVWDRYIDRDPVVPRSVPQPFAGIAEECLRSDPARRCSLSEIRARIEGGSPVSEPVRPEPPAEPAPGQIAEKPSGRRRGVMIFAVAFVLAAAAMTLGLRKHHVAPGFDSGKKLTMSASAPSSSPGPAPTVATPVPVPTSSVAPTSPSEAQKGEVTARVQPDVSAGARDSIHGHVDVTVRVTVDASGNVSNASLDSPGPSRYFAKQAAEAAQHWEFKPAQVGGRGVASEWTLQFRFTQTGTDITPVEVSP